MQKHLTLIFFALILPFSLVTAEVREFRLGVVAPLSGSQAMYGQYIREGLELARAGLQDQVPLKLIYEDDSCSGALGVSATRKLLAKDKVHAIFGSWCSTVVLAQAPIAEENRRILMALAISPQVKDAGKYVYRIQPDASYYLDELSRYAVGELNLKRWAIFHIVNDFGQDQSETLAALLRGRGAEVLVNAPYLPGTNDFRTQLLHIRASNPQALFLASYVEAGSIARQVKEIGLDAQIIGSVPFENPEILKTAAQASEGIIFPTHFDPDSTLPSVRAYQAAYTAKYGRSSEGVAMLAYDALNLLHALFARCRLDTRCVQKALDTEEFQGVTGPFRFDKNGDSIRQIFIRKVVNGNYITLPPNTPVPISTQPPATM